MSIILIDGLNVHHKFKLKNVVKSLAGNAIGGALGGGLLGGLLNKKKGAPGEPQQDYSGPAQLDKLAGEEAAKRTALGQQQQQQILDFANNQEKRAGDYRTSLAQSLNKQGQDFFALENPSILEDLNSRGLFTSQTARDQSQAKALKEIELNNQSQLTNFDTNSFNNINDIRGTALSSLLGGEQGALDSALDLRKAGVQRQFDVADRQAQQSFAEMLAKRQSRDQLISSIIGGVSGVGAGFAGK